MQKSMNSKITSGKEVTIYHANIYEKDALNALYFRNTQYLSKNMNVKDKKE